jgi:hypothetical protein
MVVHAMDNDEDKPLLGVVTFFSCLEVVLDVVLPWDLVFF